GLVDDDLDPEQRVLHRDPVETEIRGRYELADGPEVEALVRRAVIGLDEHPRIARQAQPLEIERRVELPPPTLGAHADADARARDALPPGEVDPPDHALSSTVRTRTRRSRRGSKPTASSANSAAWIA